MSDLPIHVSITGAGTVLGELKAIKAAQQQVNGAGGPTGQPGALMAARRQETAAYIAGVKAQNAEFITGIKQRREAREVEAQHQVTVGANAWRRVGAAGGLALGVVGKASIGMVDFIGSQFKAMWAAVERMGKGAMLGVAYGAWRSVKEGFRGVVSEEQTLVGYATLLHSKTKAEELNKQVQKFVVNQPFAQSSVENSVNALLVAKAKNPMQALTNMGNAAAASGGGSSALNSLATIVSRVAMSQRIDSETMQSLASLKIDLPSALAKALNSSPEAMALRLRNGGATSGIAMYRNVGETEGLLKALGNMYPNAMQDQGNTLLGMWQTAINGIKFAVKDGLKDVIPQLKETLQMLTPIISGFARFTTLLLALGVRHTPTLKRALGALVDWLLVKWSAFMDLLMAHMPQIISTWLAFKKILRDLWESMVRLKPVAKYLIDVLAQVANAGTQHPEGAANVIKGMVGIGIALKVLIPLFKAFQLVSASASGGLLATLGISAATVGWVALIVAAVVALGAAMFWLYRHNEKFKRLWDQTWRLGKDVLMPVILALKALWWILKLIVPPIVSILGLLLGGAVSLIANIIGGIATAFEWVGHAIGAVVGWIARLRWPTPPSWVRAAWHATVTGVKAISSGVVAVVGDEGSPRMFNHSAGFHNAMAARTPGTQMITSGFRTDNLGSVNSDHRRGAYDLVGANLGSYAASVGAAGGYAARHGSHLHVVPPMGDTLSPLTGQGGQGSSGSARPIYINIYPANETDLVRSVNKIRRDAERDDYERARRGRF